MKKYFKELSSIILAILFCANVSAQIGHSVYNTSVTGGDFQSLISVFNSATNETWFVATSDDNVVVTKMDIDQNSLYSPFLLKPLTVTAFPFMPPGKTYLKSGFFDPEGNIFAYGYDMQNKGVIMRIVISDGNAKSLRISTVGAPVDDACWAYETNGTAKPDPVCYGIIFGNRFAKVLNAPSSFSICATVECNTPEKTLCSVIYDQRLKGFRVSGYSNNSGMFLNNVHNHNSIDPTTALSIGGSGELYSQQVSAYPSPNRIVAGKQDFIMIQPVAIGSSDGLWVINFSIGTSTIYKFPQGNISVIDAKYCSNGSNEYLYVLGHYNGLDNSNQVVSKRYLAKMDINDTTICNVRLLDEAYLSHLEYDNSGLMRISGAAAPNGDVYLVSELDLSATPPEITVEVQVCMALDTNFDGLNVINPQSCVAKTVMTPISDNVNAVALTSSFGLTSEKFKASITPVQQIEVVKKTFTVSNFENNCKFKIVDNSGKTLQEGSTLNGVVNNIKVSKSGAYTIIVTDEKNNTQSSKVVTVQ